MNAIYYCTRRGANSGGEAVNEDHVVALRELGYRAYLFYIEDTPIGHFASRAPVLRAGSSMAFAPRDVIVMPEPWKLHIDGFAPINVKKVMHCQNPYYLFNGVDDVSQIAQKGISAVITCSDYTTGLLRRAGYAGALQTVQPALSSLFKDSAPKKLQIAYMPRKREFETSFVKGLFKSLYPELAGIPWVPIHNMSLADCARTLDESAVFSAFSYIEGLGLPPLEAMASGCVVVGFNGLGGADYATPHNGFWINEGDHMGFAHALAEGLRAAAQPQWRGAILQSAKATAARYCTEHFRSDLQRFWEAYLGEDKHEYLLGPG
ncbi:MAG: glycosyltransferase [Rhodoferax sp.]|nr:glycosyltransferase [Rhodoferax sp.]